MASASNSDNFNVVPRQKGSDWGVGPPQLATFDSAGREGVHLTIQVRMRSAVSEFAFPLNSLLKPWA